jgi:hypothetical protein
MKAGTTILQQVTDLRKIVIKKAAGLHKTFIKLSSTFAANAL